jgi:anion-transporting  ArsA/GET3 family ATPase
VDPAQFFTASRLAIVAGKGGVGKTTVSAALALAAARSGFTTLIVEVEGKSGLAAAFGEQPFAYDEILLSPAGERGDGEVRARALTSDDALLEYLQAHGMARLSKRLVSSGMLDVVATAVPGIKDILVLGKVKQLERAVAQGEPGAPDFLVLDAPAAGHAITFLQSARGLVDAVTVGPINSQASDVLELLTDPARCQVVLVTLPEETPVNELVETAYSLEDKVGVSLGPVVVNGLYPELAGIDTDPEEAAAAAGTSLRSGEATALAGAADFRRQRMALQRHQLDRLGELLPLPQVRLPYLFNADLGVADLERLATGMLEGIAATLELAPTEG